MLYRCGGFAATACACSPHVSSCAYLVGRAVPLPAVASAVVGALAAVAVAAALQTRTSLRLSPR